VHSCIGIVLSMFSFWLILAWHLCVVLLCDVRESMHAEAAIGSHLKFEWNILELQSTLRYVDTLNWSLVGDQSASGENLRISEHLNA